MSVDDVAAGVDPERDVGFTLIGYGFREPPGKLGF